MSDVVDLANAEKRGYRRGLRDAIEAVEKLKQENRSRYRILIRRKSAIYAISKLSTNSLVYGGDRCEE